MNSPILITIDDLNRMSDERHAWLGRAAEQIRQWKLEDAAAGQPWGEDGAAGGVDDARYDDDDADCANCGGEGFTYGCSWDWQCATYDEGEGTCLCTRPCDWCQPPWVGGDADA